jgi:hypothetical protein
MEGKVERKIRDNDWEQRKWESEKDSEGEKRRNLGNSATCKL